MTESSSTSAFGLDLGSESTYLVDSQCNIIRNELGGHSSGTLVAFAGGERIIGEAAVGQASTNPKNTVGQLHLLLGHSSPQSFASAQPLAPHLPFRREASTSGGGGEGKLAVTVDYTTCAAGAETETTFLPEALLAMLLAKLKTLALPSSPQPPPSSSAQTSSFGVAVPPWLSAQARQSVQDAAAIAGIPQVTLVGYPEALCRVLAKKHPIQTAPSAAAAEASEEAAAADAPSTEVPPPPPQQQQEEQGAGKVLLLVDCGATHLTAVCARFFAPPAAAAAANADNADEQECFEILSSASDPLLGVASGVDASVLFPLLREKAFKKIGGEKVLGYGLDSFAAPGTRTGLRLLRGVERLRKLLSTMPTAEVAVENICEDCDVQLCLSRQELKDALTSGASFLDRVQSLVSKVVADSANLNQATGSVVDGVETLGGGCRMPLVQQAIADALGSAGHLVFGQRLDSSALAYGAALAAVAVGAAAAADLADEDTVGGIPVPAAVGEEEDSTSSGGAIAAATPPPVPDVPATKASQVLVPGLGQDLVAQCAKAEAEMQAADEGIRAVAEARNAVESYILSMRQAPLHPKHGHKVTQVGLLNEALDDAETWLYGYDSGTTDVVSLGLRLSALRHMVDEDYCAAYLSALKAEQEQADAEMEAAAKAEEALRFAAADVEGLDEDVSKADRDTRKLCKAERMKKVMKHKETGTELFKDGNYLHAAKHYKDALSHASKFVEPAFADPNSEDSQELKAVKVTLLLNLATCWAKLDNQDQVLKCANDALALDPTSTKALFRRATVSEKRGDFSGAKKDLDKALKSSPHAKKDASLATLVKRVDIQIKREKDKEKKMYGKMFA